MGPLTVEKRCAVNRQAQIQIQIEAIVADDHIASMVFALAYLINTIDQPTATLLKEGCIDLSDRDYLALARPEIWGEILREGVAAIGARVAAELGGDGLTPQQALEAYYTGLGEGALLEVLKFRVSEGMPLFFEGE